MDKLLLTLLLLVTGSIIQCDAIQCYNCASVKLQTKWQLTSFPIKMLDAQFDAKCDRSADLSAWTTGTIQCNSACVLLIVQDPDSGIGDETLYVRGCLEQLMGWNPGSTASCNYGTIQSKDGQNNPVQVKALGEFCTTEKCNNRVGFPADGSGLCQTSTQSVQCVQCESTSNCDGGQTCTGNYCYKADVDIGNTRTVVKGCSPMNPYGKTDCERLQMNYYVPTKALIEYDGYHCYCNDRAQCNSAGKLAGTMLTFAISLILGARFF